MGQRYYFLGFRIKESDPIPADSRLAFLLKYAKRLGLFIEYNGEGEQIEKADLEALKALTSGLILKRRRGEQTADGAGGVGK